VGGYGLELNFGSLAQPPIAPPNTVVLQQPDAGSSSTPNALTPSVTGPSAVPGAQWAPLSNLAGWAMVTDAPQGGGTLNHQRSSSPLIPIPTVSSALAGPIAAGASGDSPMAQASVGDAASSDLVLQAVALSLSDWNFTSSPPGTSVPKKTLFELTLN
jgi:hypothetical protein